MALAQAQSHLDALTKTYVEQAGPLKEALLNAGAHTVIASLQEDRVRNVRTALQLLWGGVLFVLLIAAVNITNLALARTSGRVRELATRHAIGAAQARVARQLLIEAGLLPVAGAGLGLVLARWSLSALPWIGVTDLPRASEIRMDAVVVLFTIGLALTLGLIVGVVAFVAVERTQLEQRPARGGAIGHGRPKLAKDAAHARRGAGGLCVRPLVRRRSAPGELSAVACGRPRFQVGSSADRTSHAAGRSI